MDTTQNNWAGIQAAVSQLQQQPEMTTQLKQQIAEYFRQEMKKSKGLFTPEILRAADEIYDIPTMPSLIVDALGVPLYDLRLALAKRTVGKCEQCGTPLQTTALRSIGGYSSPQPSLCRRCTRSAAEENREQWKERDEREESRHLYRRGVELQILRSSAPLDEPDFRKHLQAYASYWIAGTPHHNGSGDYIYEGKGCMICGQDHALRLLVALPDAFDPDSIFWQRARMLFDDCEPQWDWEQRYPLPALTSPYQVLWRLKPEHYYNEMPHFPITQMAFLVLCDRCATRMSETHNVVLGVE